MKHSLWMMVFALMMLSCKDSSTEETVAQNEPFEYDMYVPSEMANLMNDMYDHNLQVKQDILDGKQPTEFPEEFLKIHSAEFTKGKGRNETFDNFSKLYISTQKEIYNPDSEVDLKSRFNSSINLCISCHQTECTGPIPRIKKLIIK